MKKRKGYSIGLDIGTASVGWACMTSEFEFLKYNGRYTIGVHEFESAETAEGRRLKRGGRRRYNRRIKRIQLLQETLEPLFEEDPDFLPVLNSESNHYWKNNNEFEGRSLSETLAILGENTRKYPTIYHLRHDLIQSTERFDPKLIYLALHNLTKFRGHFLNAGMSWNSNDLSDSTMVMLDELIKEMAIGTEFTGTILEPELVQIIEVIEKNESTKSDKLKIVTKIAGKEFNQLFRMLLGLKTNVHMLFPNSSNMETYKNDKIAILLGSEEVETTMELLTDEEQIVIEKASILFQAFTLKELLGEANYVAQAKVNSYNQFGEDLRELQSVYNEFYGKNSYRQMFITSKKNSGEYRKTRDVKLLCEFDKFLKLKKDHEDSFYNNLKKKLEKTTKKDDISEESKKRLTNIVTRIDDNKFLQKQKGSVNASIPHQNNLFEATQILKGQQPFHPEITDEMIERVTQIIGFRIPYYIGPLVKTENPKFGWLERMDENQNLTPWNFESVIDKSKSAEKFITQMTGYCSYLTEEKVLPKHSLLYQKFEVLNELNGIQLRNSNETASRNFRLDTEEKEWLLKNVFQNYKSVTHARLKNELKKSQFKNLIIDTETEGLKQIHGTQKESKFATSLSTFIDMEEIFGSLENVDTLMLEEIIYWLTVFTESEIIELKIKEKYPDVTRGQISKLTKLNYTGWGRLSGKLLDGIRLEGTNNETVIETMQKENKLFMEVLNEEKYDLEKKIEKENLKNQTEITKIKYSDIAELQGSPAIKRGIWRAVLIVEELVSIFGEPDNIMLEFAREDGDKGRTKSRAQLWKEITAGIPASEKELKAFANKHNKHSDAEYQNNRFSLYLSQQGKCLYSGEALDLNQLSNYEIDHILPKNFVKDDSIDNLALVKTKMNQEKQGTKMPLEIIPLGKRMERILYWRRLYENKMISGKKYHLLLKERFTDQDKESFFARQLVETRQIIKHVSVLLEERFEKTNIHPLKAGFISKFRNHVEVPKIREYNNKHHAVDAALGLVIVQFIINKYGSNFLKFNFKYQEAREKWSQSFLQYQKNFFLFSDIDKSDKFTDYKEANNPLSARQFLSSINNEIPWQSTKKTGSNESAFYDETIYSPNATKGKNPQYKSEKTAIGVHSGMKVDSTYLVSYCYLNIEDKEISENRLIDLYVIEKHQLKGVSDEALAFFLAEKESGKIIKKAEIQVKLLKHQLLLNKGHSFYFISSNELNNAEQFEISEELMASYMKFKFMKEKEFSENLSDIKITFLAIGEEAIDQYGDLLSEGNIENIREYAEVSLVDRDAFIKGIDELFSMAGASASRSAKFGGRYRRKLNLSEILVVYQSITGLRYRKPKSFKKDLW